MWEVPLLYVVPEAVERMKQDERGFLPVHQYPPCVHDIHDGEVGAIVRLGRSGEIRQVRLRVISCRVLA